MKPENKAKLAKIARAREMRIASVFPGRTQRFQISRQELINLAREICLSEGIDWTGGTNG